MSNHDPSRRRFLVGSALAAGAFALGPSSLLRPGPARIGGGKLKLLIIGGTGFLGPHVVRRAVERGHEMTLFNRGKTNPGLFKDLEQIHGDRKKAEDLKQLAGRKFDAVIDTSAYYPRVVKMLADVVKASVGQYVMISSVSVYPNCDTEDTDESTPVGKIADETTEKITNESYGPLKALCEKAAEEAMPGKATNIRPGLIVGPGDDTDRFSYWPARIAKGGEVLAPVGPEQGIQYIDVRDLADWIIKTIEDKTFGVFNALGPKEPTKLGDLFASAKAISKSDATITWVDEAFMEAQKIGAWSDMPAWVPPTKALGRCPISSNKKAMEKGLVFRTLDDTVKATLDYVNTRPEGAKMRTGISAEREKAALAAWKAAHAPK